MVHRHFWLNLLARAWKERSVVWLAGVRRVGKTCLCQDFPEVERREPDGQDTIGLVKPHLEPDLYQWQYPARSLLDNGAVISGASDWPVSTANVFQAIYQAETRKGPQGVLDPSQRMPREAMLYAYTRNSAVAMNEQDHLGSIAPGKQADLVLVDRDVLTVPSEELRAAKVVWTMVGGKIVYESH
jgi:Predicted metal-dependent hydrolase with the TIM-barrel fold